MRKARRQVVGEIRGLLKAKFGTLAQYVIARLSRIADLVVLQSLAAEATECQSLAEFEAVLSDLP